MPDRPPDRSYRALLRVPSLGRILLGMAFARVAQAMVAIALVLFTLSEYHSPELAGVVTFASIFPGIAISPIAGVLLDRHGRIRLMIADYVVAAASLTLVAGLSSAHALPAWLLVLIAMVMSLTSIFSSVGLRTLFPLIVPRHLWERANALDSNGYVVATIFGPPIAASLVAFGGGSIALFAIGLIYGLTALSMIGVHDPLTEVTATGTLLSDARAGLVYVWRNRTLRGLGVSVSGTTPQLRGLGNRAGSVKIYGGSWELCDGNNFTGRCIVVSESVVDLARINLRDRVSSVRPFGR